MQSVVSRVQSRARRHHYQLPNGTNTWISSYVGINSVERRTLGLPSHDPVNFPPPLEPIAFLVEQEANSRLPGHYHQADQFQVFIAGTGFFGTKPITGLTVHYAMAFTPYAPIQATHTPIEYYTLRNGWDPGARWMPEHKAGLMDRKHPYRHGVCILPDLHGDNTNLAFTDGVATQIVVPFAEDGLGAILYQTKSSVQIAGPAPSTGRGQYWLVLKGECIINGERATEQSLLFVSPSDQAPTITSHQDGVAILMMQFPKRLELNNS